MQKYMKTHNFKTQVRNVELFLCVETALLKIYGVLLCPNS
jgi:hypothetical protein